jgi:hypothetical protein
MLLLSLSVMRSDSDLGAKILFLRSFSSRQVLQRKFSSVILFVFSISFHLGCFQDYKSIT